METLLWILAAIAAVFVIVLAVMVRRSGAAGRAAEEAVPPFGKFLDLAGARLHYVDRGEGPAVVLVHGNGGTLRHFAAVTEDLATDRRVIAFDRPGSGYSAPRADGDASLKAQAETLAEAIAKLDLERPVIVGHSLGGSLALRLALDHPRLVRALALVAPATRTFTSKPPFRDDAVDNAVARKAIAWTIAVPAAMKTAQATLGAVFAPAQPPADFGTTYGGALSLRPGQIAAMLADTAALQPSLRAQQDRYGELDLPITLLFGDTDGILDPAEHIDHLTAAAPQTRVETLPGAGHMAPVSAPAKVAAAIRAAADPAVAS